MESVFQYEIPVLHPMAVHFPVALIVAAIVAAIIWMVRGMSFWRRCLLFLLTLAAAGTAFAYLTGEAMEEQSEGVPIVDALVGLHEQAARYALITTVVTTVCMAGVSFWLERRTTLERDPPDPLPVRLLFGLLVLAAALLIAWTSRIGGTMVWGVALS